VLLCTLRRPTLNQRVQGPRHLDGQGLGFKALVLGVSVHVSGLQLRPGFRPLPIVDGQRAPQACEKKCGGAGTRVRRGGANRARLEYPQVPRIISASCGKASCSTKSRRFGGPPEQFTGPTDCLPDVEPPGQGLDRRHRAGSSSLGAFAPGERVSRRVCPHEAPHRARSATGTRRQSLSEAPFLRYLVLNDSRNDVISTAHLSAEYVGDASDQRMKRASIREVT